MKTNKNLSENNLHELFNQMPVDEPTPRFMENLFQRIEKEVLRERKKQHHILAGQAAAGILGIFILPALAIYFCTLFLPDFTFSFPKIHLNFDPKLLTIGFSVFMLLIIDTLLRAHGVNRSKRD